MTYRCPTCGHSLEAAIEPYRARISRPNPKEAEELARRKEQRRAWDREYRKRRYWTEPEYRARAIERSARYAARKRAGNTAASTPLTAPVPATAPARPSR